MFEQPLNEWYFYVLIVLVPIVLWMTLIVLVCLWEKRMVWYFVPVERPEESTSDSLSAGKDLFAPAQSSTDLVLPPPNQYAMDAMEQARSSGFEPLGVFRDGKGKIYRVRYNFFVSPQRDVLALVGNGTMAGIPIQGTHLYALLADGNSLLTLDNHASSPWDITGMIDEAYIPNVDFAELLDMHRVRISASPIPPIQFSEGDPLGGFRAFRVRWFERQEMMGYSRFIDMQRNVCRYCLKGALVFVIRSQSKKLRRALYPDKLRVESLSRKLNRPA